MNKKGIFALACLGHFHVDFMWGLWPIFKTVMGVDLAVAGMIVGVSSFMAEMMQVFWGALSDRGYRFAVMALGLVLVSAFGFLHTLTPTLALLCFYFPVSMGSSAFHPPAAGIVGQFNPNRRAFNMSLFWAFGAVGLSCSPLVFTFMNTYYVDHFHWIITPGLILAIAALYLFKKDTHVADVSQRFGFKDFLQLFKRRDTLLLWLGQVFIASIFWGTLFLLPDMLIDKQYPLWITNGGAHMCYVIGAAGTSMIAGWIADRTSAKWVMLTCTMIGSVFFYGLLWNGTMEPAYVLSSCFLIGAFLGQCSPLSIAHGNALVPEKPALISAFLMGFVWFIAETIGTTGTGLATKLFSEHQPTYALTCLGLLFIPAWVALYLMPEKSKGWQSQTV